MYDREKKSFVYLPVFEEFACMQEKGNTWAPEKGLGQHWQETSYKWLVEISF